jgi:hypothetical protein
MTVTTKLEHILEELEQAEGLEGLQAGIEALRDHLIVDHVVYHWVDSAGDQYGCGTYPEAWVQRYLDKNYLRVDPVIAGCFQRFHPVDWKRLDWSSKAARAFQKEAISYGGAIKGFRFRSVVQMGNLHCLQSAIPVTMTHGPPLRRPKPKI